MSKRDFVAAREREFKNLVYEMQAREEEALMKDGAGPYDVEFWYRAGLRNDAPSRVAGWQIGPDKTLQIGSFIPDQV